jgi:hypothetical protein
MDDNGVAEYLLKKKYHLVALELHQELLEGNHGVHSVAALNKFFGDAANYAALVRSVEGEEAANRKNGACSAARGAQRGARGHVRGRRRSVMRRRRRRAAAAARAARAPRPPAAHSWAPTTRGCRAHGRRAPAPAPRASSVHGAPPTRPT